LTQAPASGFWDPTEGNYFASLWSTDGFGTDTSTLTQTFTTPTFAGPGGGKVQFDYFYDFGDVVPFEDPARIYVVDSLGNSVFDMTINDPFAGTGLGDDANIDWTSLSVNLPSAGTYTLGFEINDSIGVFMSILGVDNVKIGGDNEPPTANAGPDQTVEQDSHDGTLVTLDGSGSTDDGLEQPLTYIWTWTDGSVTGVSPSTTFPLGTTTVTLTVDDGEFTDSDTVDISVVDTTRPTINNVSASPDLLWPPNHRMVEVTVTVDCEDICDPAPFCYIVGVTSNEPINGPGDGNTDADWEITDDLTVYLRAERAGGDNGRVYTIHVICEDASGNIILADVDVTVPHDQGKGKGKKKK
jgi:hypothetical protein